MSRLSRSLLHGPLAATRLGYSGLAASLAKLADLLVPMWPHTTPRRVTSYYFLSDLAGNSGLEASTECAARSRPHAGHGRGAVTTSLKVPTRGVPNTALTD